MTLPSSAALDLIVLPFHDWKKIETEGPRGRDGHLLEHFLASPRVGKVLLIDRPISIPERLIKGRPLRCRSGSEIARRGPAILSRITEKLFVLDIAARDLVSPLLLGRDWWDTAFSRPAVHEAFRWAAREAGLATERRVLFCWSPLSTGAFGQADERAIVFDAIDNWCRHPEMRDRRGWIRRGYERACADAKVLTCNSEGTAEFLRSLGGTPRVIRNGVDAGFWDPVRWSSQKVPEDLAGISRPWIGYSGRLAKRIDVPLLLELAKRRPEWSIVLVGPELDRKWMDPLRLCANIRFLGDKPYANLPAYVVHFDAAIIPHNVGPLENDGDPTKLYEYLALALPVVTTPIAGVREFAEHVGIEKDAAGFERAIAGAIERRASDSRAFAHNRNAVLTAGYKWSARADELLNAIVSALDAPERKS